MYIPHRVSFPVGVWLDHRDREFAVEPIGRHRIARFTDHCASALDDILRDQSRMAATIRVRHAIEFVRGYLIQGTQKPIAPRSGREAAYVGLDHAAILRARRPNRHSLSNRQMQCMNQVRLIRRNAEHHDVVPAWLDHPMLFDRPSGCGLNDDVRRADWRAYQLRVYECTP